MNSDNCLVGDNFNLHLQGDCGVNNKKFKMTEISGEDDWQFRCYLSLVKEIIGWWDPIKYRELREKWETVFIPGIPLSFSNKLSLINFEKYWHLYKTKSLK